MRNDKDHRIREGHLLLSTAHRTGTVVAQLSETLPGLSIDEAYAIQKAMISERVSAGDRIVGHKIGLTSRPMQEMFGVDQPDFGHLLASMAQPVGEPVTYPLIQPRVEPEIAFILKETVGGPGVTMERVLAATAYICPALEVIDSRIRDWNIRFVDTVADNASSGCFLLGSATQAALGRDLAAIGVVLRKDGEVVQTGTGAAVLGHPARAVAWLANTLALYGQELKAGQVVLSGSMTAAIPVTPGSHIRATVAGLGSVEAYFPR